MKSIEVVLRRNDAMNSLLSALHNLLPLLGIIFLVIGIRADRINYIIAALWLSLIALLLHYQTAGGEILGSYFGYANAAVYTANLLVLIISLFCLFYKLPIFQSKKSRYAIGFISASVVIGSLLLLTNIWINAFFIENRRPGTPIMQVATFKLLNYCTYRYAFYKIGMDGKVSYMCPDYYGVFPSIGHLDVLPNFVVNHLAQPVSTQNKMAR